MAAAYRDSVPYIVSSNSLTVDPSTLTYSSGDVLVLFAWGYTSLGAPSGSDLTWTQRLTDTQAGPFGATDIHTVWTAVADASITSFTIAHGVTDQIGAVLVSVSGADTTTPVDVAAIASNAFTAVSNADSPSVDPTGTDSLLLCGVGVWTNADATSSFTAPSGMTEREDFQSWDSYSVATEALASGAATGVRTWTESPDLAGVDAAWIASSIAIKSGAAAGDATATPAVIAAVATVPAVTLAVDLVKTFYLTDALASSSGYMALQDGGTPPATARITTGWIVGTVASGNYARMDAQTERASASHTSTVQPSGAPDNTLGDCFRSPSTLSGTFSAGNWSFSIPVQGETRATSTHDGRLRIRVWRSANADGSSPTEITGATQVTSAYADLANSASQTLTLSWSASSFSLSTEYLFIQIAHEITGAGNNANSDTHLVVGSAASVTTTSLASGTGATKTPAVIAAVASLPAAGKTAASTVTPAVVPATAALPAASANTASGSTVTPAVLPAVAALPASTPIAASTKTATVIPTAAALPAATPATGSSRSPAVIPVVSAAPVASAGGHATKTPAVIPVVVEVGELATEQDWTADPAVVPAVVALPAATANTGSGATKTPAVIAAVTALPAATPATGTTKSPAVLPAATAVPAPATSTGATTTPVAVPVVVALPASTPVAASTVAPAVVPATVALPAPTISAAGNATQTPSVIPTTAALLAATPSAGSTPTPAVVPATSALPAATTVTQGNATAAPAVVPTTAALPPASTATGATASPAAIAAIVTLPTSTAAIGDTRAPATITVSFATPAATTDTGSGATPTPSVIAVTTGVNTPTVTAASVRAPAVIAVLVSLPDVTVLSLAAEVVGSSLPSVSAGGESTATVGVAAVSFPTVSRP